MPQDPPDLVIETDVGLMQIFAGEVKIDIEPRTQRMRFVRKMVEDYTNLVISFELPNTDGNDITINLPVHYLWRMSYTLRSSVFEVPCSLILHLNNLGIGELQERVPDCLSAWKEYYAEKKMEFPEFLMFVIDPAEMSWKEFGVVLWHEPFGQMHNMFVDTIKLHWEKHLREQKKQEHVDINYLIKPLDDALFSTFYEKLSLKNIESTFFVNRNPVRIFIQVKKETRISRRALRLKAAQAGAATKAIRRKQREEEEMLGSYGEGAADSSDTLNLNEDEDESTFVANADAIDATESMHERKLNKRHSNNKLILEGNSKPADETQKGIGKKTVDHSDIASTSNLDEFNSDYGTLRAEEDDDCAEESEKAVVADKKPKRRKKPKRISAPRRKKVRRSPSYDIEEEEILLIESEFRRQTGKTSESDTDNNSDKTTDIPAC